jgi:primosomal protein N' (replication factor Y)
VAVLHSGLTDAERYNQWRLIRSAQVQIVVGARSAIFAPLASLGVVIVDEEHDSSFKQEEGVRYNARDLALVRAKRSAAIAVLGTATPSLESYHGAQHGRLTLLEMPHRATPRPLPRVQIIDLRIYKTDHQRILSFPLSQAIGEVLERREQAILFINRRGFSTFVLCKACGHAFRCKNCSVTLTHHRSRQQLICHYCGYAIAMPRKCPKCLSESIELMGLGTEQVEDHLIQQFPQARVARLDRDTSAGRGSRSILARMSRQEIDLLVGTQMVTKGHDFPHVTLVGVICADLGLHFPDFRSAERTFQLLTQVAGRAGRGDRSGRVLIQTYNPDHPSLRHVRTHDYRGFYNEEVQARRELGYPPWGYLATVRIDGEHAPTVIETARSLAQSARAAIDDLKNTPMEILGPAEAPIQRLKGRTRWLLLLKGRSREGLRLVINGILTYPPMQHRGQLKVSVDVDPLMML